MSRVSVTADVVVFTVRGSALRVPLGRRLDKRNFRRKILARGLLQPRREKQAGRPHRPARLYSFRLRRMRILDGQIV